MVWYDDDNVWVICIQWYVQTVMYKYMYTSVCTSIFLYTVKLWSILYDAHSRIHAMMQWCDDAYYTMHSMMYMYAMLWWTLYDAHSPIPAIHSDLMI